MDKQQAALKGKVLITGILKVETGMHIGAGSDFAPIGSVDSPFIRDVLTQNPIIPGSSIKGKMRTLLAKNRCDGYILNEIDKDDDILKRLFGSTADKAARPARLQFFDLFITEESKDIFSKLDSDTYLGEVKFENVISRLTGEANPRQIERVPAGMEFNFKLVYNIENEEEYKADIAVLREGFKLLQVDYLGGHGSRGYGRISFHSFAAELIGNATVDVADIEEILRK